MAHLHGQQRTPASYTWAELMERVFETNPLECLVCHSLMRIVEFVTDADSICEILSAMKLATEPPSIMPAQEAPLLEFQHTRLVYDEQKDLLMVLDLSAGPEIAAVNQSDPFPDYANTSQEPAEWLSC